MTDFELFDKKFKLPKYEFVEGFDSNDEFFLYLIQKGLDEKLANGIFKEDEIEALGDWLGEMEGETLGEYEGLIEGEIEGLNEADGDWEGLIEGE